MRCMWRRPRCGVVPPSVRDERASVLASVKGYAGWWLGAFALMAGSAQGAELTVKRDGTGDFTSIQACADAAKAGDTCLVHPGVYAEHVRTVAGGTSEANRVVFRAQGTATMQGFDIKHPHVTVEGFDVTGYGQRFSGHVTITAGGTGCHILHNTIRDGADDVYGIYFYSTSGQAAANCIVRGNKITNLRYPFLMTNGDGHLFEGNTFESQNGEDYVRLFGASHVFRRNVFWRGRAASGAGNHPDFVQSFGLAGSKSENHLFEENWIHDMQSQFSQLNSGDAVPSNGILHANVRNITFRKNVIAGVTNNANIGMPGVTFENNTFYRLAYELSGMAFGGSLTRGDSSRSTLKNNVFLAGGSGSESSGYYFLSGAVFSKEVLAVFVTRERDASGTISYGGPITAGIFDDLRASAYIDPNGKILARARALSDVGQFVLNAQYETYRRAVYDKLVETVRLDASIRSTFLADYNFVAGAETAGFPAKRASDCGGSSGYVEWNFCEAHGVNGGDPRLKNLASPLGPDGVPFTLDDGLKPLPTSPLCGRGEGGGDIGAYSCDPALVFDGSPRAPTNVRIVP